MATSDRAFNQVKAILGKLDQRIDSLRERRTAPPPVAVGPASPAHSIQNQLIGVGSDQKNRVTPVPTSPNPIGTTTPPPSRSTYGRAVPLRNVS